MGLSTLGIFHTLIGVIAILTAMISYAQHTKINLSVWSGKVYVYATIIASISALGLSKQGGFNPGHVLALIILLFIAVAVYLHTQRQGSNNLRFLENFSLSFTFFLSLIPTVVETFQRVPIGQPLATSPTDPIIAKTLLVILLTFLVGSVYQFRVQRRINRSFARERS